MAAELNVVSCVCAQTVVVVLYRQLLARWLSCLIFALEGNPCI